MQQHHVSYIVARALIKRRHPGITSNSTVGLGAPSLAFSKCCTHQTPDMQLAGGERHKTGPLVMGIEGFSITGIWLEFCKGGKSL